jgi:hypothetical protein
VHTDWTENWYNEIIMWILLIVVSSFTSFLSILMMYRVYKKGGKNANSFFIIKPFILGALSLFVLLDSLAYIYFGKSFIYIFFFGNFVSEIFILSFFLLAIGMAIDFAGIYLVDAWEYPPVTRNKSWYLVYAPMWIIFGFCMHLFWFLIQNLNMGVLVNLFLTTLIGFLSLEIINCYGSAWVYKGIFRKPVILFFGWFILTITCIILPALYVANPLGLKF